MPVFKRFGAGDQIDNVLVLEPQYNLASGSEGWRGSPEGSASLHLYGGARRRPGTFSAVQYESDLPAARQVGHPIRSFPLTASVKFAWMTNSPLNFAMRTDDRWGSEHWAPIEGLFRDYSSVNPEYTTASYDYYSVYFNRTSYNTIVDNTVSDDGTTAVYPTSSFTLESWVNPFNTASAGPQTIQSIKEMLWFGVSGSNGRLFLSSSAGVASSSLFVPNGQWTHVAARFDSSTLTGSFFIGLKHAGDFTLAAPLSASSTTRLWSVGNVIGASTDSATSSGTLGMSWHGLLGETRVWGSARTYAEMSGSAFSRTSVGPLFSLQMREGPLGGIAQGSGTLDSARSVQGRTNRTARLTGFNRKGPMWVPSDNALFMPDRTQNTGSVQGMLVVDVPSAFFGKRITPGSVRMVDSTWSAPTHGMVRTVVDDGRGGLFISGSVCSGSTGDYAVRWNKVGNVFYDHGLIVIRDPALFDFGRTDGETSHARDVFQLSFRGTSMVPVKTLMCRLEAGEVNCTTNPTFSEVEEDGVRVRVNQTGSLYITTVGVYNSQHELVGVARVADPIKVPDGRRLNVKLRMDF